MLGTSAVMISTRDSGDAGGLQHVAVTGVAVHGRHAFLAQPPHGVEVELDDGWHDAVVAQQPRQRASRRAVADDDGPVAGRPRRIGRHRAIGALGAARQRIEHAPEARALGDPSLEAGSAR